MLLILGVTITGTLRFVNTRIHFRILVILFAVRDVCVFVCVCVCVCVLFVVCKGECECRACFVISRVCSVCAVCACVCARVCE